MRAMVLLAMPVGRAGEEFRLLIVDDDRLMTELLPRKIQKASRAGVTIVTAKDPAEALRLLDQVRPHAVLSDFNLRARQDGIDVLAETARRSPRTARILFSAHARDEIGPRVSESAVQAYVEKPLRLDELVPKILDLVESLTGSDLRAEARRDG